MKRPIKDHAFTSGMVILAAVAVIVIGALQYRWSNQVSEATGVRLADSLQMSMTNWQLDLFRSFSEICVALRPDLEVDTRHNWNQYARRFANWNKFSTHPHLLVGIYVLTGDGYRRVRALRPDAAGVRLEPTNLPSELARLRQQLLSAPSQQTSSDWESRNSKLGLRSQTYLATSPDRSYGTDPVSDWVFEPSIPALVRPLEGDPSTDPHLRKPRDLHWMIVVLNKKAIQDRLLPDLAQRYFRGTNGLDYQVAVVAGKVAGHVIYSSDPAFGGEVVSDPDGTLNIFGHVEDASLESPIRIFRAPAKNEKPAESAIITWFPLLQNATSDQDWRLIVRHRRGGALGAFVVDSRRRDLAIGFGVLLLLVISIAILIVTSTRAHRLAKLRMDFVTTVSHELRTPLTVISSAAENITSGVIEEKHQLEKYGAVISAQARKLFEMVEQILLFAAIREGQQSYHLRPLDVHDILDAALTSTAGLIHTAGFHVHRNAKSNLPQVAGDLSALSQCLQNLITNALKYGGEQKWIGIQARFTEHGLNGREIQISVSDRGIGLSQEELAHIFEPFYRSPSVTSAQIHGTGLGLPLAKSVVEIMKGQVSVKSSLGRGSTFTIHLPILEGADFERGLEVRPFNQQEKTPQLPTKDS